MYMQKFLACFLIGCFILRPVQWLQEAAASDTQKADFQEELIMEQETDEEPAQKGAEPAGCAGFELVLSKLREQEVPLIEEQDELIEEVSDGSDVLFSDSDLYMETELIFEGKTAAGAETDPDRETFTEAETVTETEEVTETEGVTETEEAGETEGVTEVETVTETEGAAETEGVTETEEVTEAETVTETERNTETEAVTETDPDTEQDITDSSEPATEPETTSSSERSTESEKTAEPEPSIETEQLIDEADPSSGGETGTEINNTEESEMISGEKPGEGENETAGTQQKGSWIVRVSHIRVSSASEREYDGTDKVTLAWDVETEYRLMDTEGKAGQQGTYNQLTGTLPADPLICRAHLASEEAGVQKVIYQFALRDNVPKDTVLEVEKTSLTVNILPRKLSLHLPNGWKYYYADPSMKQIHLSGKTVVTGFVKDSSGQEKIPAEFRMPDLAVNTAVLQKGTPLYQNGSVNTVQGALVPARKSSGKLTGSTGSRNYEFDENNISGGAVTLRKAAVVRGKDYTVTGERGAYFENAAGGIWVRKGSRLQVRAAAGSGYNTVLDVGGGQMKLQSRNVSGEVLAESVPFRLQYQTDSTLPVGQILVGGGILQDGVRYTNTSVHVRILPPSDADSGIASAVYAVHHTSAEGQILRKGDMKNGVEFSLSEDGTYVITAEIIDHTGNQAFVESDQIVVDTIPPRISVFGITDRESRRDSIRIRAVSQDGYLNPDSISGELIGSNSGTVIAAQISFGSDSAQISFPEIRADGSADDIYTLRISAEDFAGNQMEKQLAFTLNSKGSVYSLDSATEKKLAVYWHKSPFPITFLEQNLDTVESAQVLCIRNRETVRLRNPQDFTSAMRLESGGHLYRYSIPAGQFMKDGQYEVVLVSKDRSGGQTDTAAQLLQVRFGIDGTPPDCLITGLQNGSHLKAKSAWIGLEPRDNLCLGELRLYLDGREVLEKSAKQIEQTDGLLRYQLHEKNAWQRLQVYVRDAAGNEYWSEELAVYVNSDTEAEVPEFKKNSPTARELREAAESSDQISQTNRILPLDILLSNALSEWFQNVGGGLMDLTRSMRNYLSAEGVVSKSISEYKETETEGHTEYHSAENGNSTASYNGEERAAAAMAGSASGGGEGHDTADSASGGNRNHAAASASMYIRLSMLLTVMCMAAVFAAARIRRIRS